VSDVREQIVLGGKLAVTRITPAMDVAEQCNGAGVVVAGGTAFVEALVAFGYVVVVAPTLTTVDELAEALLYLREMARGKLGAIGIDRAAPAVVEAATVLPQLDAVVHVAGVLPPATAKLARIRAQLAIVRAARGKLVSDVARADLLRFAKPSRALVQVWSHPTSNDRFAIEPAGAEVDEATIAWDRIRDFLSGALL